MRNSSVIVFPLGSVLLVCERMAPDPAFPCHGQVCCVQSSVHQKWGEDLSQSGD